MNKIFLDNTERRNEFSIHPITVCSTKRNDNGRYYWDCGCGPICHRFPGDGWKVCDDNSHTFVLFPGITKTHINIFRKYIESIFHFSNQSSSSSSSSSS